jgi:4-amino-4-deoxy-L-arabinose transferase-like glycosyltransferase
MLSTIEPNANQAIHRQNFASSKKLIVLILLLAAVLYCYQLNTEAIWADEMHSIRATTDNPGLSLGTQILSPFYIFLLSHWMKLSTNPAWLRTLSAIFALGSVFCLYKIGRRTVGETEGLIAALLLTLSPLFINHAQEVRYYTLSTFVNLSGSLVLSYVLEGLTIPLIIAWIFVRGLAILILPFNLMMLLPDFVLIMWSFWGRRRQLLIGLSGILVVFGALLPHILKAASFQVQNFGDWYQTYPKPNVFLIGVELTQLTVYWPFKHLFGTNLNPSDYLAEIKQKSAINYFLENFAGGNAFWLIWYLLITAIMFVLLGMALLRIRQYRRLSWIALWGIIPAFGILAFSYLSDSIWKSRYLLFFSPYFLILLAVGFTQIWQWKKKLSIIVAFFYLASITHGLVHYYTTIYRSFNGPPA